MIERKTGDQFTVIGEMAHVIGVSHRGPRGSLQISQSADVANLILLCPTHHRLVDQDPNAYSADDLRGWKRDHERAVIRAGLTGRRPKIRTTLLRLIAPPSASSEDLANYVKVVFHSHKLAKRWEYSVQGAATCNELAAALAEQHFHPFHTSFSWNLCDEHGVLLPSGAILRECVDRAPIVTLRMTCIARPLDRAAHGHTLMYYNHELNLSGCLQRYAEKWDRHIQEHGPSEAIDLNVLAWLFLEVGINDGRAEQLLDQCAQMDRNEAESPAVLDTRAWLYYRRSEFARARKLLWCAMEGYGGKRHQDVETSDLYTILYHGYFIWTAIGEHVIAARARRRVLAWLSSWGVDMLFRKRVTEHNDSLLLPRDCRYLDAAWLQFFGIRMCDRWNLEWRG